MTENETKELEYLCASFSSLSEDNRQFALTLSKTLLKIQHTRPPSAIAGLVTGNGEHTVQFVREK
jgi:hypothetical protein